MQTFLIFLVTVFGYMEYFLFGRAQTYRPIVMCALTGLVLGDLKTGIVIGAQMELVFIGVQEIGLSIPQSVIATSVVGTSIAIQTDKTLATAITFGLPISMVVLFVGNLRYVLISPAFVAKCEKIASEGKTKLFSRLAFWGGALLHDGPAIALVTITFALGNQFAKNLISMIPTFVQDGLVVASQILPAFGFAMLLQVIMKKEIFPFFFLGFLVAAYLKLPIMGIALFGVVLIAIMFYRDQKTQQETESVTNDDEF